MNLSPTTEKFILHWGEMGTRWGVNRSIAQIHALLYLSNDPLPADEISELLSVARSNVSNSLRELQGLGIVKATHVLGDRRDHFNTTKDMWSLFFTIMDERKRREFEPTVDALRELAAMAEFDRKTDKYTRDRVTEMQRFLEEMNIWYDQMRTVPQPTLVKLIRMGKKITRLLSK